MFQIIAVLYAKPECVKEVEEIGKSLVAPSRADAGNIKYEFFKDALADGVFVFCEQWQDDASLNAHMNTPVFKAAAAKLEKTLAKPMELHKLMLK